MDESRGIFILIVVLYGEVQTLTISTRKKYFLFIKKNSYDNFSFEDGIKIREKFSETRNNNSFIFYKNLISKKVTGAKTKFYSSFFLYGYWFFTKFFIDV